MCARAWRQFRQRSNPAIPAEANAGAASEQLAQHAPHAATAQPLDGGDVEHEWTSGGRWEEGCQLRWLLGVEEVGLKIGRIGGGGGWVRMQVRKVLSIILR